MPEFAVKSPVSLGDQPLVKSNQSNGQNCPMDWSEMSNGLVKSDQPIPNINTDINTDDIDGAKKPKKVKLL